MTFKYTLNVITIADIRWALYLLPSPYT